MNGFLVTSLLLKVETSVEIIHDIQLLKTSLLSLLATGPFFFQNVLKLMAQQTCDSTDDSTDSTSLNVSLFKFQTLFFPSVWWSQPL